jgi:hypothetical protein
MLWQMYSVLRKVLLRGTKIFVSYRRLYWWNNRNENNFNREVFNILIASYGYPFSPEEAEIYARQAIRFGAWESVIRAIDGMGHRNKKIAGNIG